MDEYYCQSYYEFPSEERYQKCEENLEEECDYRVSIVEYRENSEWEYGFPDYSCYKSSYCKYLGNFFCMTGLCDYYINKNSIVKYLIVHEKIKGIDNDLNLRSDATIAKYYLD